jgi:single-stranded-DNA-specific exonuclease
VVEARTMGNGGEHLRFKLRQNGTTWNSVAFRQGNSSSQLSPYIDIVYNLELDHWQGVNSLRLNILDFNGADQDGR